MKLGLWSSYGSGLIVMAAAGAVYSFPSYAQRIKADLGWDQEQIELVGEMLHVGVYMGPFIGILVDVFSPAFNYAVAGTCTGVGYLLASFLVDPSIRSHKVSPGSLAFMFFLVGFGSGLMYTCTLACNVRNFADQEQNGNNKEGGQKKKRGLIVATMVSLYGFGAMIFSGLFSLVKTPSSFLRAMALVLVIENVIGALLVKRVPLTMVANVDGNKSLERSAIPIGERLKNVWKCLIKLVTNKIFWFSFIAFILGTGGGLMYINNVGNLVKSLNNGVDIPKITFACVSILSVFNGLGRILMGFTDYSQLKRGYWYFFALLIMALAQILNAAILSSPQIVYFTTIIVGLSYGMLWSITPTLVSEIFGPEEFGLVWGWYTFGPAIASFIFNSVAGRVYEAHAPAGSKNCAGTQCYDEAFLFASCAAFIGSGFAYLIVKVTKPGRTKFNFDDQVAKEPSSVKLGDIQGTVETN